MPKYRVLKKLFTDRVYQPGEIIDFAGPGSEDTMEPIGNAPMAARRFDIPGLAGMPLEKRSEVYATRLYADATRDPTRHLTKAKN